MCNDFYGKKSGSQNGGGLLNTQQNTVFNAYGASGELVNTSPSKGFRNAAGNKHKMWGADGEATTGSVAVSTTNGMPPVGVNVPTLLVFAIGVIVGNFLCKEGII